VNAGFNGHARSIEVEVVRQSAQDGIGVAHQGQDAIMIAHIEVCGDESRTLIGPQKTREMVEPNSGEPNLAHVWSLQEIISAGRALQTGAEYQHAHAAVLHGSKRKSKSKRPSPRLLVPVLESRHTMRQYSAMADPSSSADWRAHLLVTTDQIDALLARTRHIAVLGIKPESHGDRPAFFVAEYAQRAGFDVIPVPVYYPSVKEILGRPVVRRLVDVTVPIDLVNVFRRPEHISQHLEDMLAARPRAVWFQSGIRHDQIAEQLARAGIDVVQDRCLMVELSRRGQ
jgi:uncharacterized protein